MSNSKPKTSVVEMSDAIPDAQTSGESESTNKTTGERKIAGESATKKKRGNLTEAERQQRVIDRQAAKKSKRKADRLAANAALKEAKNQPSRVVEVRPMASRARMRGRHWGVIFSFVFYVIVPLIIAAWYIWERAEDRFASTVGFTIQQEAALSVASPLTDAFSALGGSSGSPDAEILYEYLQSQRLIEAIQSEFDLKAHYSQFYDSDPIFSLSPDATLEDLVDYWPRILYIVYDEGSGLIKLRVVAHDGQTAQAIATAVLSNSQALINDLNTQARTDTIRYAEEDLASAVAELSAARGELVKFRTRTQIVDPETDLAGRLGIVNMLQQQLAEALVEYDVLTSATSDSDPRILQAQNRIDVIRNRMEQERANVARGQETELGEDYPTLLAQYEELVVRREIAEQSYRVALGSFEVARAEAGRQSRYLAAYITPTMPQSATYPERLNLMGLITLFVVLIWTVGVLIYYSVRDNR